MKLPRISILFVPLLVAGVVVAAEATNSGQLEAPAGALAPQMQLAGWQGMMGGWPMGRGWQGAGPMPRHHMAMMWGVPAPYTSMTNPLPRTEATLKKGAAVYAANCVSCHGEQGLGDGEAGRNLSPPPGNLAWLSDMPLSQWDAFMYWTIAEGGAQFGTAMPAFKDSLSKDEIWAVTAYIQAHLPHESK